MQITIEVPDSLAAWAKGEGVSPEAYAAYVVKRSLARSQSSVPSRQPRMNAEEFLRVFPIRDRELPHLNHEDLRRENLYGDRF